MVKPVDEELRPEIETIRYSVDRIECLEYVARAARNLSAAMVDAEARGWDFDAVDDEWNDVIYALQLLNGKIRDPRLEA